jgi:hypothetical protein
MDYSAPCGRLDHVDGDWLRYRMSWSGALLRAREPITVLVEHEPPQHRRTVELAEGDLVEAVGRAYDQMCHWAFDLLFVRSGEHDGRCVYRKTGQLGDTFDRELGAVGP